MPLTERAPSLKPNWVAFGEWIGRKQDELRPSMSDRELGRRVGLSPTHIGYLKKGRTGTKPEHIAAIAIALGSNEREARAVLLPDDADENTIVGRRLGPILSQAPLEQQEEILETLVEVATRMVKMTAQ